MIIPISDCHLSMKSDVFKKRQIPIIFFLLIIEYNVITCCTIYHIINIKVLVLFSVLLDQFLMFLIHSVNFDAHTFI